MSENDHENELNEGRQDPAEPKQTDQSTDTSGQTEATPEAPQSAEPQPVQVSPEDQAVTNTVLGQDYTVTPEEGYRRVPGESAEQNVESRVEDNDES